MTGTGAYESLDGTGKMLADSIAARLAEPGATARGIVRDVEAITSAVDVTMRFLHPGIDPEIWRPFVTMLGHAVLDRVALCSAVAPGKAH